MKRFNIAGTCRPDEHYMVDISDRVEVIRGMVAQGDYFCVNRGRQYGKTTTLEAVADRLTEGYTVFYISLEGSSSDVFSSVQTVSAYFLKLLLYNVRMGLSSLSDKATTILADAVEGKDRIDDLTFAYTIPQICKANGRSIVIIIDEVDQASSYDSFLGLLGLFRKMFLNKSKVPTFRSVILASVHDIKNLKLHLRPEDEHESNSPWNVCANESKASSLLERFAECSQTSPYGNIAVPFTVDMTLSEDGIRGMLNEYEQDHRTGMDICLMARQLRDYTGGYPFLVSRLCMIMDEQKGWSRDGFFRAEKSLLIERNTFFDDINKKIEQYPELRFLLRRILFNGDSIAYNADVRWQEICIMYGYIIIDEKSKSLRIANRIIETRLYNKFIDEDKIQTIMYNEGSAAKMNYTQEGHLDMEHILQHFCMSFRDIYGDKPDEFVESEGRRLFMMYIRPIINGVGHYYVEAQTRDYTRTDLIIDYLGEQYVLELKVWRGRSYNERGERQLAAYMDYFHADKAYMLSFCFNKGKQPGLRQPVDIDGKTLVEAIV